MIRNWDEKQLLMDYSNIGVPCSDIDLFHVTPSGFLIIGEIKNQRGYLGRAQRALLTQIVEQNEKGGTVLYITHTGDVHRGDTVVDVSKCVVEEYYWNHEWIEPERFTTVKDAINRLEEMK